MNKIKARVCTALLVIVLTFVLVTSFFIKSYYGFSLYQLILGSLGYMWLGEHVENFYKWLLK